MPTFTVDEMLHATKGTLLVSVPGVRRLRNLSTDSRTCRPGDCFIALTGDTFDGHAFVREAYRRGAHGVVIDRRRHDEILSTLRQSRRSGQSGRGLLVIGVDDSLQALQDLAAFHRRKWDRPLVAMTGSNGKTTTKDMTACVLGQRWRVLKTEGNRNNRIGVPQTLLRLTRRYDLAVVEMGVDQRGQTTRLCEIARPTAGVITNIGPDHLAFFGSMAASAEAKAELLDEMPKDGVVALNAEDPFYDMLKRRAHCRVISFGLTPRADVWGDQLSINQRDMTFRLHLPSGRRSWRIALAVGGHHNAMNALAAAALGHALAVPASEIAEGLAAFRPAAMRSQVRRVNGMTVLYDCYNANPASMHAALDLLAEVGRNRRTLAVLGEMRELGAKENAFHREIGAHLAAKSITYLIACGPLAAEYQKGARAAGMPAHATFVVRDAAEAAELVGTLMQPGDVMLLKGSRGARMESVLDLLPRHPGTSNARS